MALHDEDIKLEYRSDYDDLVDFYVRCLSQSTSYDRAVGYFTSNGLSTAGRGVVSLIKRGGSMRLVASPHLSEQDIRDIEMGYRMRPQVVAEAVTRELESVSDEIIMRRIQNLAYLVSIGRLEIKLAFRTDAKGTPRHGIFHEKVGVFHDGEEAVAFSGSPNETMSGLVDNFEDINVFTTWRDRERVGRKIEHFEQLWKNAVPGLTVIDFPEVAKERLISMKPTSPLEEIKGVARRPGAATELRPYQQEAIDAWEANSTVGILSMATGTGKTLVALEALRPLVTSGVIPLIIVPSELLLVQWGKAIERSYPGSRVILCHRGFGTWIGDVEATLLSEMKPFSDRPRFIVSTMQSASGDEFLRTLTRFGRPERIAMIVDEVHRIGAPKFRSALNLRCKARLGLSATPMRQWDEEGTEAIMGYFEKVVYDYPLRKAIDGGYLAEYDYHIQPVPMTLDELSEYQDISKRLAAVIQSIVKGRPDLQNLPLPRLLARLEDSPEKYQAVTALLISRRRIVKKASAKFNRMVDLASGLRGRRSLVYCEDYEQLDTALTAMLANDLNPAEYTARLDSDSRQAVLSALEHGHVDLLLSCKCLDEGVDIPSCEAAILVANSKSTREFIQRRGRLLRPHPKKEKSLILDLLVVPSDRLDKKTVLDGMIRGILVSELQRASLFAQDALNSEEATDDIHKICELFGIDFDETMPEGNRE